MERAVACDPQIFARLLTTAFIMLAGPTGSTGKSCCPILHPKSFSHKMVPWHGYMQAPLTCRQHRVQHGMTWPIIFTDDMHKTQTGIKWGLN